MTVSKPHSGGARGWRRPRRVTTSGETSASTKASLCDSAAIASGQTALFFVLPRALRSASAASWRRRKRLFSPAPRHCASRNRRDDASSWPSARMSVVPSTLASRRAPLDGEVSPHHRFAPRASRRGTPRRINQRTPAVDDASEDEPTRDVNTADFTVKQSAASSRRDRGAGVALSKRERITLSRPPLPDATPPASPHPFPSRLDCSRRPQRHAPRRHVGVFPIRRREVHLDAQRVVLHPYHPTRVTLRGRLPQRLDDVLAVDLRAFSFSRWSVVGARRIPCGRAPAKPAKPSAPSA